MNLARQLFEDYKYYKRYTATGQKLKRRCSYYRDLKITKPRLKLMNELVTWCKDRQINPRQWLYSLFAARKWIVPPQLNQSHLLSQKQIPKYKSLTDYRMFQRRVQETQFAQDKSDYDDPARWDPRRDLNNTVEKTKRYQLNLGGPDACMSLMETETLGYHPRSSLCQSCPAQLDCLSNLQSRFDFDIVALREGKLKSSEAATKAAQQVNTYGR